MQQQLYSKSHRASQPVPLMPYEGKVSTGPAHPFVGCSPLGTVQARGAVMRTSPSNNAAQPAQH